MRIRQSALAIACFLMVGITPNYAQPATGKDVSLMAPDGIQLQATYFAAPKPGPGIMLFHQCDGGRQEWANLAFMLSANGFHVLTLDYRGFGDSGDKRYSDLDPEARRTVQAKWTGDIEVALNYLLAQSAVDKNRIGVGGASCGANNSVALAIRHPEVKTLVLLSGGTNVAGLDFIHEADWLPIFAAASDDDGGFVPYLRWILSFSKNPQTKFVEYKKAGHGTDMFVVEKGLEPAIVDWFVKTLRDSTLEHGNISVAPRASPEFDFWSSLTSPTGAARALDLFQTAKARNPGVVLFPMYAVETLGRERLRRGDLWEAIQLFKLNVVAYPRSPITYYSLANAYFEEGNREQAIRFCQQALQHLDEDSTVSQDARDFIRKDTARIVQQMRPPEKKKP